MKLFFYRGACSLSPHIALLEAGLPFTLEKVDPKSNITADGANFLDINAKGSVPALQLDDGRVLTEGPAIVQYIADLKPESHLAPPAGTFERYQLMEMLNYITSELHKTFSTLFNPAVPADWRESTLSALKKKLAWLEAHLGEQPFLMGDTFTVADGYLFTVLSWSRPLKLDLAPWPVLVAYQARVLGRPRVQDALRAEGLIK